MAERVVIVREVVAGCSWRYIHGQPVRVQKFNPNHDARGRFAHGGAGGKDALSAEYFSKGPRVEIAPEDEAHVSAWTQKYIGHALTPAEYGRLSGCPDGGLVQVSRDRVLYGGVQLKAYDAHYGDASTRLLGERDGKPFLYNQNLYLQDSAPEGLGTRVFATQVHAARDLGIGTIELDASRGAGVNGYYTWPRLGADADLYTAERSRLPAGLAGATRISDLMRTQPGRDWWKANGVSMDVVFDTSPTSLSSKILSGYLAKKGVELGA